MTLAELRSLAGLGGPLRPRQGRRRGRGRQRRRLRQAVQSSSIRGGCAPGHSARRRCAKRSAPATWMSAGAPSSSPSSSSWCAAAAISKASPTSRTSCSRPRAACRCGCSDVARVELGPDERRGIAELNGEGEVASGIVLQRFGANALDVIDNVKARLAEIASSLPSGAEIVPVYDRSQLIERAIETLKAHADRGERHRRAGLHRLPAARAQRAGRDPHAAGRHPDGVRGDEGARARLQHHEPRRHRHRRRRDDRCRDRHDRERPQASGARAAGQAARRDPDRGGERGRAGAVLQPARHHRLVPADLHAGGAGRAGCSGRSPSPRPSPWRRRRCCR